VEMHPDDAADRGVHEGDLVRVESRRGAIVVRARVGHVRRGAVFAPFHYGTFDLTDIQAARNPRQANELTMTVWDSVSKQPYFKTAACQVTKVADGTGPAPAPTTAASAPLDRSVSRTEGGGPTSSEWVPTPTYPNDPAEVAADESDGGSR